MPHFWERVPAGSRLTLLSCPINRDVVNGFSNSIVLILSQAFKYLYQITFEVRTPSPPKKVQLWVEQMSNSYERHTFPVFLWFFPLRVTFRNCLKPYPHLIFGHKSPCDFINSSWKESALACESVPFRPPQIIYFFDAIRFRVAATHQEPRNLLY